jgi:hypothetical protein
MLAPMFWGIKVGMFKVNYGRSIGSTQFNFFREDVREILAHDDNFVALGKHKFAKNSFTSCMFIVMLQATNLCSQAMTTMK